MVEFLYFGAKEARACLFVGLFFTAVFAVPRGGLLGVPRYDLLLLIAVAVQAWMLWAKLETVDEFKAICLFHVIGFALEVYKTSGGSDPGRTRTSGTRRFSAFRCSRASCTPRSAAMSFRRGGYWTCRFGITRRTGWRASTRSRSMRTSSHITISETCAGTSRRARLGFMHARR